MKPTELSIDPESLALSADEVLALLQTMDKKADDHVLHVVESCLDECRSLSQPRGAFLVTKARGTAGSGEIRAGGARFRTGNTVSRLMKGAQSYALFLATIGPGPEERARSLINEGLYLEGYVTDLVASALAEAAAARVHEAIRSTGEDKGLACTNRYSPGYCGWDVAEQQKLFALFPEGSCGIRLSPSSLMSPIKSVSGVIGLGARVHFREYSCELCDMKTCMYRRTRASLS